MNRGQLQEWNDYADNREFDEDTEEYNESDLIEIDDYNALSTVQERNPNIDKIVFLQAYDFSHDLKDYDWSSFRRKVLYEIEQEKENKI